MYLYWKYNIGNAIKIRLVYFVHNDNYIIIKVRFELIIMIIYTVLCILFKKYIYIWVFSLYNLIDNN